MNRLNKYSKLVDARLAALVPEVKKGSFVHGEIPWLNNDAMRYSLLAGGKRLRPAMLLAAADMLGGDPAIALEFACAVEMIHCYSLIHDDLPGMDDDTMRRGQPTNHMVFGVGQAILAGDGLLNLAYEVMLAAASKGGEPARLVSAMREIAAGAGARGMIGGQSMDLHFEQSGDADADALRYIHLNKTARMFMHPLRAAARISGADEGALSALTSYGEAFGLLFQATDDLLDVQGDADEIGKSIGKDAASGKLTCVKVYGIEGTRELIARAHARAISSVASFGDRAVFFTELADDMIDRTK
ncbi:MAG: polyprenyl synthetase family protein [Christensenellales bacterium]|jgi:geranylgeranyl diphosphate synthase type II